MCNIRRVEARCRDGGGFVDEYGMFCYANVNGRLVFNRLIGRARARTARCRGDISFSQVIGEDGHERKALLERGGFRGLIRIFGCEEEEEAFRGGAMVL